MAYYTGAADGAIDLLSQVKALLPQQGWEVIRDDHVEPANYGVILSGAGAYYRLAITEATQVLSISARRLLQVAQGYAGGALVNPQGTEVAKFIAQGWWPAVMFPASWHLFLGTQHLYLVVRAAAGEYIHVSLGKLELTGGLAGGWFVSGCWSRGNQDRDTSFPPVLSTVPQGILWQGLGHSGSSWRRVMDNSVVILEDPDTGEMVTFTPGLGKAGSYTNTDRRWYCLSCEPVLLSAAVHPDRMRLMASADSRTGITRLFPMSILWSGAQSRLFHVGAPPAIAVCLLDFVQPGQVVTVDGVDWMVFPRRIRNLEALQDRIGYAYRVN